MLLPACADMLPCAITVQPGRISVSRFRGVCKSFAVVQCSLSTSSHHFMLWVPGLYLAAESPLKGCRESPLKDCSGI